MSIYDDFTPVSSFAEMEEIRRQKEEQEEADANFREQRKKDEALFGMQRVTGRSIGIAEKVGEFMGMTEREHEVAPEAIQAAVSESVAELNSMASGATKVAPAAPTADITAFKSGASSDEAQGEIRRQEILSVADKYFTNNNVVSKGDRAKWISENPQDFLKMYSQIGGMIYRTKLPDKNMWIR